MDLILLTQNHVLVRNPRKMLITPDDNGDLHICADLADGAIPHLVKLTKAGYTAEQLVKGYFSLLDYIETADVSFTVLENDAYAGTREEALETIAEMQE